MEKMYTLDNKLLVGTPEIRIGDTIITIDDREKTVKKALKLFNSTEEDTEKVDSLLRLALSKEDYKKVDEMNMPYAAYQNLITLIIAAMTGEAPEKLAENEEERFQQ